MKDVTYTIIIPHKNIPDLLRRCLASIPKFENLQIIVVDDNSDPNKVDFVHFPGLGEPCVEVYFTKEGRGAGYARNVGLNYARGEWLLFADADDTFNEGFVQVLDLYSKSSFDIVYFKTNGFLESSGKYSYRNYFYDIQYDYAKMKKDMNLYYYYMYQPWGKMIKRDLVVKNNILFDEVKVSNDRMFSVKTVFFAKKICCSKEAVYTSFSQSNSLVTLSGSAENYIRLKVDINLSKFLIGNNCYRYHINLYKLIVSRTIRNGFFCFLKSIFLLIKEFSLRVWIKDLFMLFAYEIPFVIYKKQQIRKYTL